MSDFLLVRFDTPELLSVPSVHIYNFISWIQMSDDLNTSLPEDQKRETLRHGFLYLISYLTFIMILLCIFAILSSVKISWIKNAFCVKS